MRLHQLVEATRVAGLDVRVANGDEELSFLVGVEDEAEALDEGFDVLPAVVVSQPAVEDAALSLGQLAVDALAQETQLGRVRLVLSDRSHDGTGERAWLEATLQLFQTVTPAELSSICSV